MPESNIWPIHDSIPSEIAAFFDPFGNAIHSTLIHDIVGEDVLITGAGPIGIMSVAICNFVGARNIVITDINDYRLKLAESMGATKAINITKNSIKECYPELNIKNENQKIAIITPDKDIIPDAQTLNPAYIVFENYEIILQWNRSLRFALAVCTLKDKFKNEI